MVDPKLFFRHVFFSNRDHQHEKRVQHLVEKVILRLPEERQFESDGCMFFGTRDDAIMFWDIMNSVLCSDVNLKDRLVNDYTLSPKGNCWYGMTRGMSLYAITIMVDDFDLRSDHYIMGLIAHELAEFSFAWKNIRKKLMTNYVIGSIEHADHEKKVNDEARRLGFNEEIDTLLATSNHF